MITLEHMEMTEQPRLCWGGHLFLCRHNDVFEHGGKPVSIATKVILGRTDSVKGRRGSSGSAHSHPRKIRLEKKQAW